MNKALSLKVFGLVFFAFAHSSVWAEQICLRDDVCFPETTVVDSQRLQLQGSSEYSYLFFRLYGSALYAPAEALQQGLKFGTFPVQLRLHYYREFEPDDFVKSGTNYIYKNPSNLPEFIEKPLQKMNALYEQIEKGDVYSITYTPGTGVSLALNGEEKGSISDARFGIAYLGIWLNPAYSLSSKFSKKLLSGLEYQSL